MGVVDTFKGLPLGAKIIVTLLGIAVGAYSLGIISLIVIGVMANTVTSGDIVVSAATNTSVTGLLTSYNTLVTTILNPFATIGALVIVVVLVAIFFGGKMPGQGSKGGVN
jgi:hypothetical protein